MRVPSMPLGVAYLASAVRDMADVTIMDAVAESDHEEPMDSDFTWYGSPLSEIRSRIEDFKPDLVGIGCIFSSLFPVVRKVCREIKAIDPDIITVTGGCYPTFMAEHCMGEPALDMIVLGEGEMTFRDIIGRLNSGASLAGIDGLAFRDGDCIVVNSRTKWIEDLDAIRFPAHDLLPMDAYKKVGIPHSLSFSGKNFAPLITSRGCPARCIYCSSARFWGNRYRFRSPENVLDEIGELISKWDINEIQFEDDNITANPSRAMNIFRGIIDRGYRIRFNFPNGLALWTLDERLVDLMVEAGCYEAILAFESGCQEVLRDIVKKPTNLEKAVKIARYIQRKGIRTDAFYIIGFPGETREQIRQTFRFANKVKTDLAYFFVANPLPGSELHKIAESKGMLRQGFNFEDLAYTRSAYHDGVFPKGELERMAGREFVKYSLRSFLRRPHIFVKRFFFDLFLKRPHYTVKILVRIWRRVVGAGTP